MNHIEKSFGKSKALDKASFDLRKGEVHALLGANGAGKSTLMKILSGVYEPDAGDILLHNQAVVFKHPKSAKDHGVFCVYQEVDTAIVPDLSVAENILLDTFAADKSLWVSKKKLHKEAKLVLTQLQADTIDVERQAFELSLAEKQLVLIARAMISQAKIIIFDEPTAPLSVFEADRLFQIISHLKEQGVGCIYISHRLPEVFKISDRITVMKEGRNITSGQTKTMSQQQVVEAMLGKVLEQFVEAKEKSIGDCLLEAEKISDGRKLRDLSFTVSKGEVLGIAGLVGAGKSELAKAIAGASPIKTGILRKSGRKLNITHPHDAITSGIVLVPEERRKEGLFIQESLSINTTFPNLKRFSKGSILQRAKESAFASSVISALNVKTGSTETRLHHLSGGNQQKIAIGKWMSVQAEVYLFDEPTKGVDIGAKGEIFSLIHQLAEEGKGVIYFSSEIHELLAICDRVLVMYDGAFVKEFSRSAATQEKVLLYASGGREERSDERKEHTISI
ncbi:sugar ABC transporter ATP-binding protein [Bacillus mesophilum]|uniref:Autoinducer 2 import ATP-binding protein LsrA n=2 Tax=Bacillus mesophilum TaxID=1071718 RepID=A0A7V7RIE3_9BACI|nr:sugar ABC transporter ATP-binding protein [Bacillus mesophilum]KAB2329892.1 sugar ABC transporter ATP-binding protein [Bacillus mesophilum]